MIFIKKEGLEPLTYIILGIYLFISLTFVFFLNFDRSILLSLAAIIITFAIASISFGLAKKSNIMTKTIADSSFKDSIAELENIRLSIREKYIIIAEKIKHNKNYKKSIAFKIDKSTYMVNFIFSIRKCKIYFERAMLFKEYLDDNQKEEIIHFIDNLFQEYSIGKKEIKNFVIKDKQKNQLGQMVDSFDTFNEYFNLDKKRKRRIEINLKFLKDKSNMICFF